MIETKTYEATVDDFTGKEITAGGWTIATLGNPTKEYHSQSLVQGAIGVLVQKIGVESTCRMFADELESLLKKELADQESARLLAQAAAYPEPQVGDRVRILNTANVNPAYFGKVGEIVGTNASWDFDLNLGGDLGTVPVYSTEIEVLDLGF